MNFKLPPNWRTMLVGFITAFAAFVEFSPHLFQKWPWITELSKFVVVGGLAAFGIYAKDKRVTGGDIANSRNNPEVVAETAKTPPPKQV